MHFKILTASKTKGNNCLHGFVVFCIIYIFSFSKFSIAWTQAAFSIYRTLNHSRWCEANDPKMKLITSTDCFVCWCMAEAIIYSCVFLHRKHLFWNTWARLKHTVIILTTILILVALTVTLIQGMRWYISSTLVSADMRAVDCHRCIDG